ncbi:hypothetical protein GLAREA_08086 [Glarea lozoyensis ATCC 20868]|uniref:Uncharacterized protein n=1 Tax=Glarea lozoyensis (strain ATCC 20868 / MF5171) TaxID=1116229 RepID=S3CWN6_GLAL2|nr:uncharacterized protein GLAREA_08086 [Glarea lozoyensis ATCC 20868]EPE24236.1 hypothetical protein GLAREA_08086 [Glarea lozoyensis ATCC 20868]
MPLATCVVFMEISDSQSLHSEALLSSLSNDGHAKQQDYNRLKKWPTLEKGKPFRPKAIGDRGTSQSEYCERTPCIQGFLENPGPASSFCKQYTATVESAEPQSTLPSFINGCLSNTVSISSACSCLESYPTVSLTSADISLNTGVPLVSTPTSQRTPDVASSSYSAAGSSSVRNMARAPIDETSIPVSTGNGDSQSQSPSSSKSVSTRPRKFSQTKITSKRTRVYNMTTTGTDARGSSFTSVLQVTPSKSALNMTQLLSSPTASVTGKSISVSTAITTNDQGQTISSEVQVTSESSLAFRNSSTGKVRPSGASFNFTQPGVNTKDTAMMSGTQDPLSSSRLTNNSLAMPPIVPVVFPTQV